MYHYVYIIYMLVGSQWSLPKWWPRNSNSRISCSLDPPWPAPSESPFLALHGFCFFCEGCLVVKMDHLQMGRPWHSNQYFYREGRFCMFGASRDFSGLTTPSPAQAVWLLTELLLLSPWPEKTVATNTHIAMHGHEGTGRLATSLRRHTASTAGTSPRSSGAFPVKALKNWHGVLLYMVHLTFKYQFGCWLLKVHVIVWYSMSRLQHFLSCNIGDNIVCDFSVRSLISAAGVKNYVITHRFLEHISVLK